MLDFMAQQCQLTVISVGYRLAPEDPYPAGNEDCFDAAEYLVDHAEEGFGAKLFFMGGDSAGGHLSVVTAFHLLNTRPEFAFQGLVLNFGCYDLAGFLPQAHTFDMDLVLDRKIMNKYVARVWNSCTGRKRAACANGGIVIIGTSRRICRGHVKQRDAIPPFRPSSRI